MWGRRPERKGGWSSEGSVCSGRAFPTDPLERTKDDEAFWEPGGADVREAIAVWMPSETGLMLRAPHGFFHFREQSTEPGSDSNAQKAAGWRHSPSGMPSRNLPQRAH